jgi:hypothetical protein
LHLAPAPCLPPDACSLLLLWIALPLTAFSLVKGQRMNYVEPLVPAAAILAGAGWNWLCDNWARAGALARAMALTTAALPTVFGLTVLGLPMFLPDLGRMQPTLGQALALILAGLLAVLAGALAWLALRRGRMLSAGVALTAAALALWALSLPATVVHHEHYGTRESCQFLRARQEAGERVAFFRDYVHSVGFQLGGNLPVVEPDGNTAAWASLWKSPSAPGEAGKVMSWKQFAREVRRREAGIWLVAPPNQIDEITEWTRRKGLRCGLLRLGRGVILVHVRPARAEKA